MRRRTGSAGGGFAEEGCGPSQSLSHLHSLCICKFPGLARLHQASTLYRSWHAAIDLNVERTYKAPFFPLVVGLIVLAAIEELPLAIL